MSTLKDKIHVFHDLPELKWGNAFYDFFLYSALCVGIPDKLPTETEKLYYNKEKFKDIYLPQVDKSFLLIGHQERACMSYSTKKSLPYLP